MLLSFVLLLTVSKIISCHNSHPLQSPCVLKYFKTSYECISTTKDNGLIFRNAVTGACFAIYCTFFLLSVLSAILNWRLSSFRFQDCSDMLIDTFQLLKLYLLFLCVFYFVVCVVVSFVCVILVVNFGISVLIFIFVLSIMCKFLWCLCVRTREAVSVGRSLCSKLHLKIVTRIKCFFLNFTCSISWL